MEKMNLFGNNKESNEISGMAETLLGILPLTEEKRVELILGYICDVISAGIKLDYIQNLKSVRPYIDGHSCAIRISVANYEPFDIWIVVGCIPCTNTLVMTTDFTNIGITNAKDIVKMLNNYFAGMNFMLDIDTNEN